LFRLGLSDRITIQHTSISKFISGQKFDIIVSNPPYVPSHRLPMLQKEISFESERALDGGYDGLDVVREILGRCEELLRPGGTLWLGMPEIRGFY